MCVEVYRTRRYQHRATREPQDSGEPIAIDIGGKIVLAQFQLPIQVQFAGELPIRCTGHYQTLFGFPILRTCLLPRGRTPVMNEDPFLPHVIACCIEGPSTGKVNRDSSTRPKGRHIKFPMLVETAHLLHNSDQNPTVLTLAPDYPFSSYSVVLHSGRSSQ